jgi:anti-anti-sigma regulatory factor
MGRPTVVVDCAALPEADAELVDALARLHLDLRRRGCELRLVGASRRLVELIEFAGLAGVLRVEPRGKAEEREDACRVEEERDLGDPSV